MGKYAAGELKPPSISTSREAGNHPQLMPSTPTWVVANSAGVILSVCDEEVARYETVTITATVVPALLLPPPLTSMDEHLVAGLPTLEPYARLFHRGGPPHGSSDAASEGKVVGLVLLHVREEVHEEGLARLVRPAQSKQTTDELDNPSFRL